MNMVHGVNGGRIPESRAGHPLGRRRSAQFHLDPLSLHPNVNDSGPSPPVSPIALQISMPSRMYPSSNRPYTSHSANEQPRSFTAPPQVQQSLPKNQPEASRLRALNKEYRSRSSDGPETPDQSVGNFSRPRQPSLRRRNDSPKPLIHAAATFPLQSHDEEQIPTEYPETRERGLSASSSSEMTNLSNLPLRTSTSIPDYHTPDSIYTRQRNLNNSAYRPGRSSRPNSNYSTHRREPIQKPTGFDREEIRASFRSALTTNSSYVGTTETERSSVLTKRSSRTSVYGRDEGMSVDDFLGMYESGFQDSGVEDNTETRPGTASSEQQRISNLSEAMNDSLAVPLSNAIIRDSTAMFRNGGLDVATPDATPDATPEGVPDVQNQYFDERPSSSRPTTQSITAPFDATRDRHGFRKKTQHVSLAQYEAWNGPYTEYLARRRKKWVVLLKENGLITDHPTRFPPKSAKVKRFVRKGIPPDWRGEAWFYYAGGPSMIAKQPGVYDELVRQAGLGEVTETDNEIIERDLNRTFPDNVRFKPDPSPESARDSQQTNYEPETPLLQSLRRVLHTFSIYNPKIGYCQSLNFLAGLLLLFMNEEKSFWMLNIITRVYLPGTHEVNLEGANVDLGVLMASIKEAMPTVWTKIAGELDGSTTDPSKSMRLPPITLCTTAWFMSCFIGTLPIETTLRVWDSFFYEGSKTLFRVALTIFKLGEQEIKAVNDPMEIFQVVQTIPRRMIDCNLVMETCFKRFGNLSQGTIEQRREERRRGYADERARANGEAISVRRKGTVFRRKKDRKDGL